MKTFALPASASTVSIAVPVLSPRLRSVLLHLSAWLAYYLYEVLFLVGMELGIPPIIETAFNFSLYACLVYGHSLWLFPTYFIPRRYGRYALGLAGLTLVFYLARYGLNAYLLPALVVKMFYPITTLRIFLVQTMWRNVLFLAYSFTYSYAVYAIEMQKQLRAQEQLLRQQERSLLEADIAFLKSQINPHFLFNALNFLYSQVYPLSEPTAKSVLLLSDIMRYALNEGGEQGKVMLEKEVQHLRNYIALNQLRFGHNLQVRFEVQGSTQFLLILPLVLITFVENCFKHGELFDPAHPLVLRVQVDENRLWLHTSNRKRGGPIEQSTGIGLDNTRRRLAAIYPDRHSLTIQDLPDAYVTDLHLAL